MVSKLKSIIRRLIREPVHLLRSGLSQELRLIRSFASDYFRYRKYSYRRSRQDDGLRQLNAMIILEAHRIEKAFSLPEIRSGYGREAIRKLIGLLGQYKQCGYDQNELAFKKAQSVLAEYLRYHEKVGHDLGAFRDELFPWVNMNCDVGGYFKLTREELVPRAHGDFESCALSRYSVRSYSSKPVSVETIREVVQIARKTPSVCNRQVWHTYIIKDPKLKNDVLELQNGNRGFGDQADFLVIITADMAAFVGPGERNESYVDGGLYAMSILYALHYKGIGACPLNWMVEPPADRKMRALLHLNPSENIIMIITAGDLPENIRVAKSVRKEVDEIMTIVDAG